LNAFKSLYQENILHRDLKPTNILLHDNVIKIADFGFCKTLLGPNEMTQTMVGSPIYMAPEILKGKDIWFKERKRIRHQSGYLEHGRLLL
jgi:serine/threonine protein kinase